LKICRHYFEKIFTIQNNYKKIILIGRGKYVNYCRPFKEIGKASEKKLFKNIDAVSKTS